MSDLIRDLGEVIARHPTLSGREFQKAAQEAAQGYFEPGDLEQYATADDLNDALLRALEGLQDAV